MSSHLREVATLLLTALGIFAGHSFARDAAFPLIPVESFFRHSAYRDLVLSPSGRYLAVLYPSHDTINIGMIDLLSKQVQGLTGYPDRNTKVTWVGWKSEDRLVFGLEYIDRGLHYTSLQAINRDGTGGSTVYKYSNPIVSWLREDPNHILLSAGAGSDANAVFKIFTGDPHASDTRAVDQKPMLVVKSPGRDCSYVADNNNDVRVCVTHEADGSAKILFRNTTASGWRQLKATTASAPDFIVAGFTLNNAKLYVMSNEGRDTMALYEYDPATGERGQLVYEAPGVDVHGVVFAADHSLLAVSYIDDYWERHYVNARAAQLQKDLSDAFPDEGVGIVNASDDWKRVVVLAQSASSPGRFYLYDDDKKTVERVVAAAPWIDDKLMAQIRPIRLTARDGLDLSGYLTLPRGFPQKNLPIIVVPHGGPVGIRDVAAWRADTQFLANRGYAVLQVNFRGSGGYGKTFKESGAGEFAERMLDDIDDALKWAIEDGVADPKRACIYGLSYGGYAALMSLVRYPESYRCAISFSGLTDLNSAFRGHIRTAELYRERPREEIDFWRRVIGTHGEDSNYLKSHSPVYNADKIKAPVFIVHGALDLTIPISDATRMRNALKSDNKTVEYFERNDEGHGFSLEQNRIDVYSQIDKFLQRYNPAD
jgi:dipeptidyl aminopeptidase/acylaminoacyl peptidase